MSSHTYTCSTLHNTPVDDVCFRRLVTLKRLEDPKEAGIELELMKDWDYDKVCERVCGGEEVREMRTRLACVGRDVTNLLVTVSISFVVAGTLDPFSTLNSHPGDERPSTPPRPQPGPEQAEADAA